MFNSELSDKQLQEFITLYSDVTGATLTGDEARPLAVALLTVAAIALGNIPK